MSKEEIRVRFAPSPTGFLHIGSARIALFNFLFSRKKKGSFILRIEDTDKERSKTKYEEDIMRSLKWLSLSWDEGVIDEEGREKGNFGPYRQSKRGEIYKKYINHLLEKNLAYHCFCSKEDLEKQKEEQRKRKEPPQYKGRCFRLSERKKEKMIKEGKDFVIRLRLPENEVVEFEDAIRGKVSFNTKDIGGDFVIAKKDFSPLYNFACAIDDMQMRITHIIRGEDHISNTPKQILIKNALGAPACTYAHLPLTLGEDKSKLSKRHGAASLCEYKEKGYLPEALLNFITLLGWHPGGEKEIFSLEEIVNKFSLKDCQKSGAVFDIKKLDFINGQYIRKKDTDEIVRMCIPHLVKEGFLRPSFDEERYPPAYGGQIPKIGYYALKREKEMSYGEIYKIVSLYKERMKNLSQIGELADYFFKEDISYEEELLFWKEGKKKETIKNLEKVLEIFSNIKKWEKEEIEKEILEEANKEKDRGKMLWPLRVALSGKRASAGPFDIAATLGSETVKKRLKRAINVLKEG